MSVLKLSQIVLAGGQTQITDTLVGVQSGTTDVQFMIGNILPTIAANSNLQWWCSPTGSDSNPGTLAQPFATLQHAVTVSAKFDYQGLYFPTINLLPGTFTQATICILPELRNIGGTGNSGGGVIQGASVSTVIVFDENFQGCLHAFGTQSVWQPDQITFDTDFLGLAATNGAQIVGRGGGHIAFQNSSGFFDQPACFAATTLGQILMDQVTIDQKDIFCGPIVSNSAFAFTGIQAGNIEIDNGFLNLPSSTMTQTTGVDYVSLFGIGGTFAWFLMTVTNAASWLGFAMDVGGGNLAYITTDDGYLSNIPGASRGFQTFASGTHLDNAVIFQKVSGSGGTPRFGINEITGLPSTSVISPFQWAVFKDKSGGGVYVAYNDGGTIKQTAYNVVPSPPVTFANLPASPVQGMMVSITDGLAANCADGLCTTFGTAVTGGTGTLKLNLWYNGTNWTLTGK